MYSPNKTPMKQLPKGVIYGIGVKRKNNTAIVQLEIMLSVIHSENPSSEGLSQT